MPADGLRFFIDHVKSLKQRSASGEDGFAEEYKKLKAATDKYKHSSAYASDSGKNPVNKRKNRYKDILPFDHARVELPPLEGEECSDYINASYMKGASGGIAYIAAQGPLPVTVADFWRMLWCLRIQVVVMLCKEVEMGKHKCKRYWAEPGETLELNGITVREAGPRAAVSKDFIVRSMVAEFESEKLFVQQFHYTAWPDHGVPDTVDPILEMIQMIRDAQPEDDPPLVIHCSAGCGRTGAVCAIDYTWSLIKNKAVPANFSLYSLVCEMRQQRMACVQTKDQYVMVYKAVLKLVKDELARRHAARKATREPPPGVDRAVGVYENVQLGKPTLKPKPSHHKERRVSYENTDLSGNPVAVEEEEDDKGPTRPPLPQQDLEGTNGDARESPDVDEELFVTDIDSYQCSTDDMPLEQNEENEPMSDEEPPPPVPERTPESNELLAVKEAALSPGAGEYGNVMHTGSPSKLKNSPTDAKVNVKGLQVGNYSALGHSAGAVSVDGYGTLSHQKGAAEIHSYSSFNKQGTDTHSKLLDSNDYDMIGLPSHKQKLMPRADSYDVVGANYPKETQGSSYQEIEGEKEVEEDGAYSVVAFQKQVFLNSEKDSSPKKLIERARSESPKGMSPTVSSVSQPTLSIPQFSTLPRNTGMTAASPTPSESAGGKIKKLFRKGVFGLGKQSKPKPFKKEDITSPVVSTQSAVLDSSIVGSTPVSAGLPSPLPMLLSDDPLAFPNRVTKPRGPRPPPAHWNCKHGI